MFKPFAASSLLIACFALASSAFAEETNWTYGQRTVHAQLSHKPDFSFDKVFVMGASKEGPTVIFSCSQRFGLSATVLLQEYSPDDVFGTARRRAKARPVSIHAGNAEPKRSNWAYERKTKSLQTLKQWQAARLYNAVVTQSTVYLDIARIGKRTLTLPTPDNNFLEFKAACPAT